MVRYEIHVNKRGINTIEIPAEMKVNFDESVDLLIKNHGTPLHLTLSSTNAGMFTDFYHENLYIRDEAEYSIPIRHGAYAGFFDLVVITGYGTRRATSRVIVQPPQVKEERPKGELLQVPAPKKNRISVPAWALVAVALLLYSAWLYFRDDLLNYAAFLVLLFGVFAVWHWHRL
jgi:hypothetical protein